MIIFYGIYMSNLLKKEVTDIKRLRQILNVLFKYGFGYLIKGIKLKHVLSPHKKVMKHKFKKTESDPARLRLAFEELGGTFIKLGQLLSLRPDLIPPEYSEEFSKLQDEVKPFAFKEVKKIVEQELGESMKDLFASFDQKPIAAASIGQVHKAKLKTGEVVAIKVKRPGVNKLFHSDIHLLFYLAKLIKKYHPIELVDPEQIVKEFQKYTIKELDYIREAKNIKKFHENFKKDKTTKIPMVFLDYSTHNVLTMEYIDGIKISNVKKLDKLGYNRKKIARNLANSVFKQVYVDGFFHADPHPANVFVLKNNKIALLDFGIAGYLDSSLKQDSSDLFVALIKGDVDFLVEILLSLGFVDEPIDLQSLKDDLVDTLSEYRDTSIKYVDISMLFKNLLRIASENKIRLPVNFVLLGKSIVTVQSTCTLLNPDFNLIETALPFVKKLEKQMKSPKYLMARTVSYAQRMGKFLSKLPEQSEQLLIEMRDTDKSLKAIDKDLRSISHALSMASSHLVLGIIVVSLIIGGTMLVSYDKRTLLGIPLYTFIYLSLAAIIMFMLVLSNLHKNVR